VMLAHHVMRWVKPAWRGQGKGDGERSRHRR
jgi:hypothetical protein